MENQHHSLVRPLGSAFALDPCATQEISSSQHFTTHTQPQNESSGKLRYSKTRTHLQTHTESEDEFLHSASSETTTPGRQPVTRPMLVPSPSTPMHLSRKRSSNDLANYEDMCENIENFDLASSGSPETVYPRSGSYSTFQSAASLSPHHTSSTKTPMLSKSKSSISITSKCPVFERPSATPSRVSRASMSRSKSYSSKLATSASSMSGSATYGMSPSSVLRRLSSTGGNRPDNVSFCVANGRAVVTTASKQSSPEASFPKARSQSPQKLPSSKSMPKLHADDAITALKQVMARNRSKTATSRQAQPGYTLSKSFSTSHIAEHNLAPPMRKRQCSSNRNSPVSHSRDSSASHATSFGSPDSITRSSSLQFDSSSSRNDSPFSDLTQSPLSSVAADETLVVDARPLLSHQYCQPSLAQPLLRASEHSWCQQQMPQEMFSHEVKPARQQQFLHQPSQHLASAEHLRNIQCMQPAMQPQSASQSFVVSESQPMPFLEPFDFTPSSSVGMAQGMNQDFSGFAAAHGPYQTMGMEAMAQQKLFPASPAYSTNTFAYKSMGFQPSPDSPHIHCQSHPQSPHDYQQQQQQQAQMHLQFQLAQAQFQNQMLMGLVPSTVSSGATTPTIASQNSHLLAMNIHDGYNSTNNISIDAPVYTTGSTDHLRTPFF